MRAAGLGREARQGIPAELADSSASGGPPRSLADEAERRKDEVEKPEEERHDTGHGHGHAH